MIQNTLWYDKLRFIINHGIIKYQMIQNTLWYDKLRFIKLKQDLFLQNFEIRILTITYRTIKVNIPQ